MTMTVDADGVKRMFQQAVRDAHSGHDPAVEVYSDWKPRNDPTLADAVKAWRDKWRDPWFLSAHIQGSVSQIILERIVLPIYSGKRPRVRDALERVGEQMLKAVQANLRNSRNARGRMRPVGAKRKAIKERLGLDKRTLFAEGSLYDSLKYRIR